MTTFHTLFHKCSKANFMYLAFNWFLLEKFVYKLEHKNLLKTFSIWVENKESVYNHVWLIYDCINVKLSLIAGSFLWLTAHSDNRKCFIALCSLHKILVNLYSWQLIKMIPFLNIMNSARSHLSFWNCAVLLNCLKLQTDSRTESIRSSQLHLLSII